jgi:acyl carrier protein
MKIESIFSCIFSIPEDTIGDSTVLQNIPTWDSMMHMVLITQLEEEYQVQLTGDEIADMQTVGDARRILKGHGAAV